MLTHRQHEALSFIQRYHRRTGGVSPSVREIARAMGMRGSHYGATVLLRGLEERGFIRRIPGRKRAIEIIRPIPIADVFRFNDQTKELEPLS